MVSKVLPTGKPTKRATNLLPLYEMALDELAHKGSELIGQPAQIPILVIKRSGHSVQNTLVYTYQYGSIFPDPAAVSQFPAVAVLLDELWNSGAYRLTFTRDGDTEPTKVRWLGIAWLHIWRALLGALAAEAKDNVLREVASPPWSLANARKTAISTHFSSALATGQIEVVCQTLVAGIEIDGDEQCVADGVTIRRLNDWALSSLWTRASTKVPLDDHRRTFSPDVVIETRHTLKRNRPNGAIDITFNYGDAIQEAGHKIALLKAACMVSLGVTLPFAEVFTVVDVPFDWFANQSCKHWDGRKVHGSADLKGEGTAKCRTAFAKLDRAVSSVNEIGSAAWMFQRAAAGIYPRDILLDSVIGMEVIFANGQDSHSDISYRFRTNGAVLLALHSGNPRDLRKDLDSLYGLRCKLAHDGRITASSGPSQHDSATKALGYLARALLTVAELHEGMRGDEKFSVSDWVFERATRPDANRTG